MYCKHCGSRIEAGSVFCLNCGAPVTQTETQEVNIAPTKRNRPKWWFYVVVAVAAVAVIISFVFWARATGRFNLNQDVSEVTVESSEEHPDTFPDESETDTGDTASTGSETNIEGTDSAASEKITNISVEATSQLGNEYGNSYSPYNLFDGDRTTAYAEGVEEEVGIGEMITIILDGEYEIDEIVWYPGYQKNADIFAKNGYPTKLTFDFSDGTSIVSTVDRTPSVGTTETIPVDGEVITDSIQVTIDDAVSGYKYSDICISDMEIYGRKVS